MIKLRDYQTESIDKVFNKWKKVNNVLLVLSTGSGKTVSFCKVVEKISVNEKKPSAIIVHRKELLSQISLTLCKFNIHHNIISPPSVVKQIISLQRKDFGKQFYNHNSIVNIASVDTINSRAGNYIDRFNSIELLVIDEAAHVLKKNKWGRSIEMFNNPNLKILGVTATPQRLDKKGLGLHNDGIFEEMVEGPNTKWFIDQGFLSKYKVVAPPSDFVKNLGSVKSNTSDYSDQVIADAVRKSQIIGDIVFNYKKFANNTQAIVFAPNLASAKDIEDKFNTAGIPAKFLSSLSTDLERFQGVNLFKENKIKVLINVDLFDEGFDIPVKEGYQIIETVISARPTMSLGKFLQVCGRGLRVSPNKSQTIIIDHVGNIKRHGLPCKERKWSLERPEKKTKVENFIKVCTNCSTVYEKMLKNCPSCGVDAIAPREPGERTSPEMVDGDLVLLDPQTIHDLEQKTILESPESVERRVSMSAGGVFAGKRAYKNQAERIEVQKELANEIAIWSGYKKAKGLDDREINKLFYTTFGKTVYEALAEPKLQMTNLMEELSECNSVEEIEIEEANNARK